ncbi:MAG: hypothetical protein ABSC93_17410 [Bryobacteraceae bacterium]
MSPTDNLLPRFDDTWTAECDAVVSNNGGSPPHVACPPYPNYETYADPSVLDDENQAAMVEFLKRRGSDMLGRFAVLRYLWAASVSSVPSDGGWAFSRDGGAWPVDDHEGDLANEALRANAKRILDHFAEQLPPEGVLAPEQAMWEFKQAFLLFPWRLARLAEQYRRLTSQSSDESNLMLARALWLPNSKVGPRVILLVVCGIEADKLPWDGFIEHGYQGVDFFGTCIPPESHEEFRSRDTVIEAIACLTKVRNDARGPHWGILADCHAMVGSPEECAKIWERHGCEILKPAADFHQRKAEDLLLLPEYQLRIADLWAEGSRPDKEVEVLDALRSRHPRLAGVNRRLAERYLHMDMPDLDAATRCVQDEAGCDEAFSEDPIVRLLLHQCGRSEEAKLQLDEARSRYENNAASIGQRTAIYNVLKLSWSPFGKLSPDVQGDWTAGLWWCYGEHSPQFDEIDRAGDAVLKCCRALEPHLRETVFEPLRKNVTPAEREQLPDGHAALKSFLRGSYIDLGAMLEAVDSADSTRPGVYKKLSDLLSKKTPKPLDLKKVKYREICTIRNAVAHESRKDISGATIERARRCAELCHEFLSILELPMAPPAAVPRPGPPSPKR